MATHTRSTVVEFRIQLDEVNELYGKYEGYIQNQYTALCAMVEDTQGDPAASQLYMEEFERVFESNKCDLSLNVLYQGVIGSLLFGRPLLEVYFECCGRNRSVMEATCSHLIHIFHMGLATLLTYAAITQDDEEQVKDKWVQRVAMVQVKMEDIIRRCTL